VTKLTRRTVIAGLSAFAAMPAASAATDWPNRPVTLTVGFPPGGPVDTVSRILAEALSRRLGQSFVVETKPGATGTMACGLVARTAPDGYTLLAMPGTFSATAAMFQTLPYNPTEDFTFISTTADCPLVLVTHPDSELRTLADVIAIAHARSTPLLYGTAGIGSPQHLAMELFARKADIRLQHVPYKGGMPAITDLLGKRVDLVLDPPTTLVQFVKDGKLRALAETGGDRFFGLPDFPTMVESGFPGFVVTTCQGIAAPARLSDDVARKLNAAIAAVLTEPALIEKLRKIGYSPKPSSPQDHKASVVADIARWKGVVADAHIARI